jgi:hypothetical protein
VVGVAMVRAGRRDVVCVAVLFDAGFVLVDFEYQEFQQIANFKKALESTLMIEYGSGTDLVQAQLLKLSKVACSTDTQHTNCAIWG